ncbi:glycosyltransferase [Cohnella xylanilytica]|uniref:Glycosyltransferase n=1 Tax=Cohnella xylanilytica TaxID=557555 RepID=A0A841U244_9BACL|nr:glycosyltransferase [Cohnella xylanilytica]MBB6693248.1 glycosyltransferase [Cohnella xylanilytica]
MRVVMVGNSTLAKAQFGGRELQMIRTMHELENLGLDVQLYNEWETDLKAVDVVHVFGLDPENIRLIRFAKNMGLKIVLSSVFYPLQSPNLWRLVSKFWPSHKLFRNHIVDKREIIKLADIIAPNTTVEKRMLKHIFNVSENDCKIIANGVEERFSNGDARIFRDKYGISNNFMLYVGRIEPRKNTDKLIYAAEELKIPLVIVGSFNHEYADYVKKCKNLASENTRFIESIPHSSAELASAYTASSLFVLPSFYETPGLSALEAAAAGAKVVVTKVGGAEDYFGDFAWYIDPNDEMDIKEKIKRAWESKGNSRLKEHIIKNYNWRKIAQDTKVIYEEVCANIKRAI